MPYTMEAYFYEEIYIWLDFAMMAVSMTACSNTEERYKDQADNNSCKRKQT